MSDLTDALGALVPDVFGSRPAATNEDVARAMVMLQSPLTRPAGNDPVSREARRKAVWANAANVTPDQVRQSGLMHYGMTPERYDQAMMWAGIAPMNMIAYHGSPHKFDAFKMEKIGTGEGAQAYGHGLYFAEQPSVAKYYQVTGDNAFPVILKNGKRIDEALRTSTDLSDTALYGAIADHLPRGKAIDKTAIEKVEAGLRFRSDYFAGSPDGVAAEQALQKLRKLRPQLEGATLEYQAGNLYKVDLPDEAVAKMLDWDKPLSQQDAKVIAAIKEKYPSLFVEGRFNDRLIYPDSTNGAMRFGTPAESMTGGDFYKMLARSSEMNPLIASKNAMNMGIPGIKYLDAGSRSAGEGSRNFVVFDENLPKILERSGEKLRPAK